MVSPPRPPYSGGKGRAKRSSSARRARSPWGNWPVRSASVAWGATSSRAKARTRSRTARWSGVSSKSTRLPPCTFSRGRGSPGGLPPGGRYLRLDPADDGLQGVAGGEDLGHSLRFQGDGVVRGDGAARNEEDLAASQPVQLLAAGGQ